MRRRSLIVDSERSSACALQETGRSLLFNSRLHEVLCAGGNRSRSVWIEDVAGRATTESLGDSDLVNHGAFERSRISRRPISFSNFVPVESVVHTAANECEDQAYVLVQ